MIPGYFTTEIGRMRQREAIDRAERYRLIQQAKLAAARNGADSETGTSTSLYRKVIALIRRDRATSLDSPTRTPQTEPTYVADRVIDLGNVDDKAVPGWVAPPRPDLPPLRRLQTERDLGRALKEQLEDHELDLREPLEAQQPLQDPLATGADRDP